MKKLLTTLFVCAALNAFAQFNPNYKTNFWEYRNSLGKYYDSLSSARVQQGILNMKGTGFNNFRHWERFWKQYMPVSGDFTDAKKVFKLMEESQRQEMQIPNTRASVNWTEVGPVSFNNIEMYDPGISSWHNPHDDLSHNIRFDASVGRFDRLYKHPTNSNTIFACAGNREGAGGGLFISTNYGLTWTNAGTDKIPNGHVACFAIKPSTVAPALGTEVWLIGLVTGNVYRSTDQGTTWDPVITGIQTYANTNDNIAYDMYAHQITFIPDASNAYGVAVFAGLNGLYYSDNYAGTLANVSWNDFNLTMPANYHLNAVSANTEYVMTDAEYYVKNGTHYLIANLTKTEKDASYNVLSQRDYVVQSSFTLGSHSSLTLATFGNNLGPNQHLALSYASSNIEIKASNPNYIYISYISSAANVQVIYKYTISTLNWANINCALGTTGVYNDAHIFALSPANENDYYVIANNEKKFVNSILNVNLSPGYSVNKHSDVRDVMIDQVGSQTYLWVATDGGVYRANESNWVFEPLSEGLNTTEIDQISLAQKPPFNVSAGVFHGGLLMYDPGSNQWHNWRDGDGDYSHTTFLNPNRVYCWNQYNTADVITAGYNTTATSVTGFSSPSVSQVIATSENIPGLAFRGGNTNNLHRTYDDFATAPTSLSVSGYNSPANSNRWPDYHIFPNDPDRLMVVDCYVGTGGSPSDRIIILKDVRTASPVVEQTINIASITIGSNTYTGNFDYGAGLVIDANDHNVFRMAYKGGPSWNPADIAARVVEYNRTTGVWTDITYTMENATFPYYVGVYTMEQDRQTGTLYIGTTKGIYYLDESNQSNKTWRKYSNNVPYFGTGIAINHCQGEIYTSALARGVWKAPLYRPGNTAREWHITTNTTWTERKNLFCTLVVDAGVTLEVKSDLVVYGYQKIIVKRGGTLLVDGGKITSECGSLWHGIFVEGNSSAAQTVSSTTQGMAKFINNAIIENSHNGVANYTLDANGNVDWARTGGIIDAANSKFYNNRRASEFQAYAFANSASKFNTCIFETNTLIDPVNFPGNNGIEAFVTINAVKGILFEGNTFENTYATGIPGTNFGKGIGANEAVFIVKENAQSVGNTFRNLYRGIELTRTSATSGTVTIQNNTFDEVRVGVYLIGNALSYEITGNTFTKAAFPSVSPYLQNPYYGILTDAARDFNIVNNAFNRFTYACYLQNSSGTTDPACNVYDNTFTDNTRSVTSRYNNYKLNIKCNTFENPNSKAQMYWLNYNAIPHQGSCSNATTPAGNVFKDPVPAEKDIHNYNPTANTFTYYYHNAQVSPYISSDMIPVIWASGIAVTNTACSFTFDPAVTCDYVLPMQTPGNGNQMTLLNGDLSKYTLSEQVYYSIMKKIEEGVYPTDLDGDDIARLHEVAMEDSTVVGANARGMFIFFFKEDFEYIMPEINGSGQNNNENMPLGKKPLLFQNVPNPAGDETEIKIYLPEKTGIIEIRNFSGQLIKSYALQEENNRVKINKGELGFGVYFYSLKVNGNLIDTKKMIIIK